jgi:integrase
MAKALTAKAVERMQPDPNRRLEIPDGLLSGLYLVVQPSGAKSWAIRYRADGKSAKLTLGRYPAIELAKARDMAREKLEAVARGQNPAADRRAAKANGQAVTLPNTVNALCDLYTARHLKPNVRRWWAAAGEIDNHIRPRLGNLALDGLTKAHVRAMVREVGQAYPVAANRVLARLRAVLNWAVEEDLIEANVAAGIKRPTKEKPVDRVLSEAELRAVWNATDRLDYPAREFARLLVLSGQRRDDVRLMHWSEIDFNARAWTIPADRYKGRRAHLIPLSDAMVEILEDMPFREAGGYVLSIDGGGRAYSNVQRPKVALDKAAMVTGWTWHDLRRTCRTGLSRLGIREDVAERVLGHSVGGRIGQTYNLYEFAEEKRAALEAWARHVQGVDTGNVHQLERAR